MEAKEATVISEFEDTLVRYTSTFDSYVSTPRFDSYASILRPDPNTRPLSRHEFACQTYEKAKDESLQADDVLELKKIEDTIKGLLDENSVKTLLGRRLIYRAISHLRSLSMKKNRHYSFLVAYIQEILANFEINPKKYWLTKEEQIELNASLGIMTSDPSQRNIHLLTAAELGDIDSAARILCDRIHQWESRNLERTDRCTTEDCPHKEAYTFLTEKDDQKSFFCSILKALLLKKSMLLCPHNKLSLEELEDRGKDLIEQARKQHIDADIIIETLKLRISKDLETAVEDLLHSARQPEVEPEVEPEVKIDREKYFAHSIAYYAALHSSALTKEGKEENIMEIIKIARNAKDDESEMFARAFNIHAITIHYKIMQKVIESQTISPKLKTTLLKKFNTNPHISEEEKTSIREAYREHLSTLKPKPTPTP